MSDARTGDFCVRGVRGLRERVTVGRLVPIESRERSRRGGRLKSCGVIVFSSRFSSQAVSYGGLFWGGYKQSFLGFQVSYCPAKRGNQAGSSRNEFDSSRRGTQAIFPLLDCRSCEHFGLANIFNFTAGIFFLTKHIWINCQFSDYTFKK